MVLGVIGEVAGAQQVLWVKFGPFSSSFGNRIARTGDVDGDGRDDAVVGAPTWSGPTLATEYAGKVFLLSGATGWTLWEAAGPVQSGNLGSSVAGPGDLTGDGIPDVLVGSLDLGQARAYSGVDGSLVYAWALPSYTSVGGAGDADGDGTPDILVGTYSPPGGAHVYSGATGLEIFALPGMGDGSGLGLAVEGLGDLTGDGLADFIVGQPTNGNYATGQGNVYLHAGGSWAQFGQLGGPFGSYFGIDVARIGDVTGDGTTDFAVGARGVNSWFGEIRVFSGADLSLVTVLPGVPGHMLFGLSIDGPGDVDGDGVSDLAAGVLQGTPWGARVYSGADWSLVHEWFQPPGEFGMGLDLAGCGDVNGDDFPDVLVGSPGTVGSTSKVRMFSGSPLGVSVFGAGCPVPGGGVPRIGATGAAYVGLTIKVNLSEVPPAKPALLLLGFTNLAWWGV
ncbi:MAG: integrin alpha, partial [Planctomycetota bacterium]